MCDSAENDESLQKFLQHFVILSGTQCSEVSTLAICDLMANRLL